MTSKKPKSETTASMSGDKIGSVVIDSQNDIEVFTDGNAVNFRTVGWPMASVIFLKRLSTDRLQVCIDVTL